MGGAKITYSNVATATQPTIPAGTSMSMEVLAKEAVPADARGWIQVMVRKLPSIPVVAPISGEPVTSELQESHATPGVNAVVP